MQFSPNSVRSWKRCNNFPSSILKTGNTSGLADVCRQFVSYHLHSVAELTTATSAVTTSSDIGYLVQDISSVHDFKIVLLQ